MGLKDFFKRVAASPTELPYVVFIKKENIDEKKELEGTLEPDQHYFSVRVNQMFLTEDRKWFNEYEPMVVSLTEFVYNSAPIDHPFIVGRNALERKMQNIPKGMIFSNTRVAGIHPFRGGRIATSIVLCQVKTDDYIRKTIQLIEIISGLLSKNITRVVGVYTEAAIAVLDGLDAMLDSKNVQPIFGFRKEFDRDANDKVVPGYFAMLDKSERKWDEEKFYVADNKLLYGSSRETATDFRDINYVLCSITKREDRSDYELLPFHKSFQAIQAFAGNFYNITEKDKEKVRQKLHALNVEMQSSPDLTERQALSLLEGYVEKIQNIVTPKATILAAAKDELRVDSEWDKMWQKISNL